jgi:hypothetical protein
MNKPHLRTEWSWRRTRYKILSWIFPLFWCCRCCRCFDNTCCSCPQCWLEFFVLSFGRRSVSQFILVSGSLLGPMTRFYPYPFYNDNCFVVPLVGRPLWREDWSVTYSAIANWSGHWGPITIHYRLIWDCVPSSSPLTTRRDCGGGILTLLHTG